MVMVLLIALPLLAAVLAWLAGKHAARLVAPVTIGFPLAALALLFSARETVFDHPGHALAWRMAWLPDIGLNLGLRLDGLSFRTKKKTRHAKKQNNQTKVQKPKRNPIENRRDRIKKRKN